MADPVKPPSRPYHAPQRAAAAARTREAIVTAAKDAFERLGWPGATMHGIADQAGVSVKTVEALYRTKAELLKHVVDYAIAGDLRPIPILGREPVAAMQAAPDAPAMLDLHARQVTDIAERSAQVSWVVAGPPPPCWASQACYPTSARTTPRRCSGSPSTPAPTAASPSDAASAQPASKPGSGTSTTRCSCTSPSTGPPRRSSARPKI